MEKEAQKILEQMIALMGFENFSVSYLNDLNRLSVFISDAPFLKNNNTLAQTVEDVNFIFKNILKQKNLDSIFIDINNYRKEREDIIIKLARAAAKKSATTKKPIKLPAMNSFERRIVHSGLSIHPSVNTHSEGEGKERHVIIEPIEE